MKKLILRLLVLTLSVYLAGSIYPLLAHEAGHTHAPAPAPAPAPPPTPAPVPAAPPILDTKAAPPPVLPPTSTPTSVGGCGGATQPAPIKPAEPVVAQTPPAQDFDKPPAPGGVCHDYVGDRIGMPPPKDGIRRTETEVTSFLENKKNGYTPGTPSDRLPPGTVVQFGRAHVGIVGPDGKIHHYTQTRYGGGVQPPGTIDQIKNTTHTMTNYGTGEKYTVQPYKNAPVRVWLPPAKSKP